MNFQVVQGKPIRIMFSHRDPALRKSGTANIFIKVKTDCEVGQQRKCYIAVCISGFYGLAKIYRHSGMDVRMYG